MEAQSTKMTTSLRKTLLPSHRLIRIHLCLFFSTVSDSVRALVRNASLCVQMLDCRTPNVIYSNKPAIIFFQIFFVFVLFLGLWGVIENTNSAIWWIKLIDFHFKSAINLCTCALDLTVVL